MCANATKIPRNMFLTGGTFRFYLATLCLAQEESSPFYSTLGAYEHLGNKQSNQDTTQYLYNRIFANRKVKFRQDNILKKRNATIRSGNVTSFIHQPTVNRKRRIIRCIENICLYIITNLAQLRIHLCFFFLFNFFSFSCRWI